MSEEMRAITGPATITVALHPEYPHDLHAFMVIADDEVGDQVVSLGDADDITELVATLIRTQNMLNEADQMIEAAEADSPEDRMEIVGVVAARYYLGEDG